MTGMRKLFALAVALFVAPLALAACGGDDGGGVDPQQVIDETFGNDEKVTSGNLDVSVDATAEGAQGGSFTLTLNGPFQGDPDDPTALPQLDWTASVDAEAPQGSFDFEGGLIVTEDNAFVEYQGQAYEVGADIFGQIKQAAEAQAGQQGQQEGLSFGEQFRQSCEAQLEAVGDDTAACDIDFQGWLTNVESEGTEDIEGTESDHVHGDLNVDTMLEDLAELGQATQGAAVAPIPDLESKIEQVNEAVTEASFDLYSAVDSRLLTGLDLNLGLDPSQIEGAAQAGIESVDVGFSLRLGALNEPQTIEAPSGAKPIDELLSQLGLGGLGALGGLEGLGGGGLGGGVTPGGGGPSEEYFECASKAKSAAELQECVELLQ